MENTALQLQVDIFPFIDGSCATDNIDKINSSMKGVLSDEYS